MKTHIATRNLHEMIAESHSIHERAPTAKDLTLFDAVQLQSLHAINDLAKDDAFFKAAVQMTATEMFFKFVEDDDYYYYSYIIGGRQTAVMRCTKSPAKGEVWVERVKEQL